MVEEKEKLRRKGWRKVRRALVALGLLAAVLVVFGPALVPSFVLSGLVRERVEAALGRPVRVEHCRFGWIRGLRVGEMWVAASKNPEDWMLHVEGLKIKLEPWEWWRLTDGDAPNLGRVTVGRVTVRLPAWQEYLETAVSSGPAPGFESILVQDGEVLLDEPAARTHRKVTELRLTLGRLRGSDKAYVTASGRLILPDVQGSASTGLVSVNGLLNHFDLNRPETTTGGCEVVWSGVDLAYFLPPLESVEEARLLSAPTEGQAKISFDESELVGVEGRLDLTRLEIGRPREMPQVELERLTAGFKATLNKTTGAVKLAPTQLSGAGSSLTISGEMTRGWMSGEKPAGELHVSGTVALGPLRHNVPALGEAAGGASAVTGLVGIDKLDLSMSGEALAVVDSRIDLRRTEIDWKPWFVKPADREAVLVVKGRLDGSKADFELAEASLVVGRAEAGVEGRTAAEAPLRIAVATRGEQKKNADGSLRPWSRAGEIKVSVAEVRALTEEVPAARELVDELHLSGSAAITLTGSVDPQAASLAGVVRLEGQGLSFEVAPGVVKAAGAPFNLAATGRLCCGGLSGPAVVVECNHIETALGGGLITFDGSLGGEAALPKEGHWPAVRFDGRVEGQAVQEWLRLARPFLPGEPYAALLGNVNCDLSGWVGDEGFGLDAQVDATRMSVEVQPAAGRASAADRLFIKPLGQTAEGRTVVSYSRSADSLSVRSETALEETTINFAAAAKGAGEAVATASGGGDQVGPRYLSVRLGVKSTNVESLLRYSPALEVRAAGLHPSGGIEGQARITVSDRIAVTASLDLSSTGYEVPGELVKPAGLPQKVELSLGLPRRLGGGETECRIEQCVVTTGSTTMRCAGRLGIDLDELRLAEADPGEILRALRRIDISARAELVQEERLKSYCRRWREFSEANNFTGRATGEVSAAGTRAGGRLGVKLDATGAGFQYGEGTGKPVGTAARIEAALGTGAVVGEGVIEKFELNVGETRAACTGSLYWRGELPSRAADFSGFSLHAEGQTEQAARLVRLLPAGWLRSADPRGGFKFSLDVAGDAYGIEVDRAAFQFALFRAKYAGTAISLDGAATLTRQRLQAENLAVGVGESAVTVTADLAEPLVAPRGRIQVTGRKLDLDELLATFGSSSAKPAATTSGGATEKAGGIPADWPKIAAFMGGADVQLQVALDRFVWSDDDNIHYDWTSFASSAAIGDGRFEIKQWRAGMLEGVVEGRAKINLRETNPSALVEYEGHDLKGGPGLEALVVQLFPNMTINGHGAQTYRGLEHLFQVAGQPSFTVGTSYFEATEGTISGPAAPDWLTNLLPGLKLSIYKFGRIKSYSSLKADGSTENDMLFDGTPYCLRIMGKSKADGRTEYLLAVDLFNGVQHATLSRDLQQGIVPILRYTGWIQKGEWKDMDIEFLLPHEVAYEVFLKRNLLYQLLEQRGESRRPDFSPYDMTKPPPPK